MILIAPTEVPFLSDVGSTVRNRLFELLDPSTAVLLEQEIKRSINYSEPRVELEEVYVKEVADDNELRVTVKYKIVGYDTVFTVEQILTPTD